MTSLKRIHLEENLLIDELRAVGWTIFNKAVSGGLEYHYHADSFELCYVVRGELKWWVNNKQYTVSRGNFFLTKPHEPHGGVNGVMERCELFWIQVSFLEDAGQPLDDTAVLLDGLKRIEYRAFPAAKNMSNLFQAMLDEHLHRDRYSSTRTRATLNDILVNTLRSYDRFHDSILEKRYSPQITRAIEWMNASLPQPFKIADAAAFVNMSTNYFQKRFKQEVGTSPGEFVTRLRIREAQKLLIESTLSMTTIAHRLGFASSQYFATVFKKYTGLTPRSYRNRYSVEDPGRKPV